MILLQNQKLWARAVVALCAVCMTIAVMVVVSGCQSNPTPASPGAPSAAFAPNPAPPVPDRDPETTVRPPPTPPDVLAKQTAKWAQRADGGKAQGNEGSGVDWADPEDLRIGFAPSRAAQVVPVVQPVVVNTPSKTNTQTTAIAMEPGRGNSEASALGVGAESNRPIEVKIEPRGPAAEGARLPTAAEVMEQQLAQHVADYPRDVWAQFDYQVLQFVHDHPVPQMQPLTPLPLEDRELIAAVMDGLSNFRSTLRSDNNLLLSRKVRPILDLADRLRAQADLTIPTLTLCTKVDGFGVYTPIDPVRFQTGREQPAVVYCEVENFSSQLDDHKLWETRLAQEAVLYTESGLPVWQDKSKAIVDHARNRRHDFFITKIVRFPATLTPGHYLLKVTVVDQGANRVAEATIPVQMVAP